MALGSVATRGAAQLKLAAIVIIASAVVAAAVLALVFLSDSIEFTPPAAPAPQDTRPVSALTSLDDDQPIIFDPKLKATLVADGLDFPTRMAFVDNTSALLTLEKNTGTVMMISGMVKKPILQLSVAKGAEQGLLGITVKGTNSEYVFLYYIKTNSSGNLLGNRIYRYEWDAAQKMLVNPTRVLDLPAILGPIHNGGKMTVGKNGEPLQDNPFVSYGRWSMDYYYAYGIRNSFGLAMDSLTGKLWETENGADKFDEINVVLPPPALTAAGKS